MQSPNFYQNIQKYLNLSLKLATGGAGILSISLLALYKYQQKIIYHPTIPGLPKLSEENGYPYRNPKDKNLDYKDIEVTTEDNVKIRGWFIKQKFQSEKAPTVIFFHENAGNLGTRLDFFKYYHDIVQCNIIAFAYRGYDKSQDAEINQKGIQQDVKAIFKYVFNLPNIDKTQIYTHGRSLGGATSIHGVVDFIQINKENSDNQQQQNQNCQIQHKIQGMVIENTFTSIKDVGKTIFPKFIMNLANILLKNKWNSIECIKNIQEMPMLFIISEKDEIIPCQQMYKLQEQAKKQSNNQVKQYVIKNGDHNCNWQVDKVEYFKQLKQFINPSL
ncbi:hypothetical protein PPERSA_10069 [Pseudocohnilembus persalinus]|uniref:Serine aminopeptidase S33 domain-containing protein n=1 Tax=Pseudocohnilembus persalinus TaxID=266149 RepID=A0A0V0QJR2_PSEPJ|nr:hypothetical protein PPERSA_10069 [Pseudocohnilembus persalinus]|eukprot:KRX02452.1 hypothetical protein PPERSA_10069 [Pseudocohnilembus persalinus]